MSRCSNRCHKEIRETFWRQFDLWRSLLQLDTPPWRSTYPVWTIKDLFRMFELARKRLQDIFGFSCIFSQDQQTHKKFPQPIYRRSIICLGFMDLMQSETSLV